MPFCVRSNGLFCPCWMTARAAEMSHMEQCRACMRPEFAGIVQGMSPGLVSGKANLCKDLLLQGAHLGLVLICHVVIAEEMKDAVSYKIVELPLV